MELLNGFIATDKEKIKYPRPPFETKNSPEITPTSVKPIFTFKVLKNVGIFDGITILVNICNYSCFSCSIDVWKYSYYRKIGD